MQLKNQEVSFISNSLILLITWLVIEIAFKPDPIIASILFGCFLIAAFLKIPYSIAAVLTLYFIIPSDAVSYLFIASPAGNFPLYIVLILVFIILGFFKYGRISSTIDKREFNIYAGLFTIIIFQIICLLLFSENVILSNTVKFAFQTIGILLMIKLCRITEETVYRVCIFIICLSVIAIIEGAFEVLGGFNLYEIYRSTELSEWLDWMAVSGTSVWRAKSTFANPLIYSSAMVLSLTCVEYIRLKTNRTLVPIVLITILAVGMLMGGSRSSIVILAAYLIHYIMNSNVKQKFLAIVGIIIACTMIVYYVDLSLVFERFSTSKTDGSLKHRLTAYGVFLSLFGKYFLTGCGLGNTYTILQNQISNSFLTNTFDNAFMDFSLGVGVVGLLALVFVFKNVANICNRKDNRLIKCATWLLVALSFFLNTTKYQSLWGVFWVYIALNVYALPDIQDDGGM